MTTSPSIIIAAKPYLTIYCHARPTFPLLIPVKGDVIRCSDVYEREVEDTLRPFCRQYGPRTARSVPVRDVSTEGYDILAGNLHDVLDRINTDLEEVPFDRDLVEFSHEHDRTLSCLSINASTSDEVRVAIHHTSRTLFFPTLHRPKRNRNYHYDVAMVVEGSGRDLYEQARYCFELPATPETTPGAALEITEFRGNVAAVCASGRRTLSLALGQDSVVFNYPSVVTLNVLSRKNITFECFDSF
ncbi:hypothetical protein KM540_gp032 [Western grey kangaroopox virus]|uniref:Uncharacterized protein n=1 Tax=Western grey kangaroopox virus TaxID=1566307 RepID=A0A2C9DSI0_9POXV|nr:hypothetical protein KM540_gp032 [Western grey kangaroopox virus]ATI20963.1 hypothetical protein [Western grey kangaroopox virus]